MCFIVLGVSTPWLFFFEASALGPGKRMEAMASKYTPDIHGIDPALFTINISKSVYRMVVFVNKLKQKHAPNPGHSIKATVSAILFQSLSSCVIIIGE